MDSQDSDRGNQVVPSTPYFACRNAAVSQDSGLVPSLSLQGSASSTVISSSWTANRRLNEDRETHETPESAENIHFSGSSEADQWVPQTPVEDLPQNQPPPPPARSRRSVEQQRRVAVISAHERPASSEIGEVFEGDGIFG